MPNADVDALRAIRAASTWLQKKWPEGESPRSWRGVTWSDDRVQELDLTKSGLKELPPQIGQLTALTNLDLCDCEQLKELPPQIGQLLALTDLSLWHCKQLKELPPKIGQLTALTKLNLINCKQLKELPPQIIGQLTALTHLYLNGCEQLKELPPQIGQLTALTELVLKGCEQLKELPPQIGQLTALTSLDLSGCKQLKELPPQIGQLTALTHIYLINCEQLKELPPQIGQLTALTCLGLTGCEQLKELPPQIGQLTALISFGSLHFQGCDQLTLAPGAEMMGQPVQTIVVVYTRFLIVAPRKDAPGELLAFLRANPLAVPAFFKTILTDAAYATWLGEAVKATPELAKLTDDIGRRAIESAHSACKQVMQAALFLLGRFDVDDGKLLHRSATAAVAAADDHGDPEAKPMPRVALKAMREVEQVRAELEGRAGLDPKYVIAIKAVYVDEEAVDAGAWGMLESAAAGLEGVKLQREPGLSRSIQAHLFPSKKVMDQAPADAAPDAGRELKRGLTARSLDAISRSIQAHLFPSKKVMDQAPADAAPDAGRELKRGLTARSLDASSEYKLLIVLELADRNLKHTIDHEHIAGEDWPAIRHIASHLGRALDHVHAEGGIHADLKPLNAVGDGDTWKIIDFDVFCKVGEPFGNKIPSSGYCPPEMAKVLLAATNQDTGEVDTSLLERYVASKAYDLWSFGVVLYHLCFGRPLWLTDINDNVDLEGLRLLAAVSDEPLHLALNKALNRVKKHASADDLKTATALLRKLLEPDPSKRLKHFEDFDRPMEAVLEEPFFQGQRLDAATLDKIVETQDEIQREQKKQTKLLLTIKKLSTENKHEIRRTREVLMKGIFEATEVSKPTTFIVLNEELPEPTSEEKEQLMSEIAEDGSGVTVTGELTSVTFTEDGPRFEAVGKYKEYVDKFNTGMKWVHRLKTIGSNVAAGKVGDAFKTIKAGLGDLVTGETMYLYLVDELTCEPVRAKGYPIVITKPAEIVPKLLPVMQVGLRAMSIYNGAGGIARLFGCPVPKVPEAWATGARESVELLKQESSVAQFGVVHEEAMEGSEESKSVRGHSLRVFTDFLQKNDPGLKAGKSGDFAGLQRIGDPNDGTALWTTLTDPQEIKSALEARTREREAEARDGDKYMQRAVKSLARQAEVVAQLEKRAGERCEEEQHGNDLFSALAFTPSEGANAVVTLREELKAAHEKEAKARGEAENDCVRENEKAAVPEVAPGANAADHDQQITSQLSKIQDDLSELKRDGVKIDVKVNMCIIG